MGPIGGGLHGTEAQVMDDAALVRAVQAGDAGAYAVLYERHEPAVRRLCERWLRDDGAAVDDIVQAAFMRALEHIDRCNGESRFSGWVQVIAQRLCIDASRAAMRARARRARNQRPPVHSPEDPADTVVRHEQVDVLSGAIATLPPRQREVVVARVVEGRRPAEIAATLGVTTAAVDSLLLRARRKLLTAYGAFSDETGGVTLPTASAIAVTAAVTAQPDPLLRMAAAVGGWAAAPFSSLASTGSAAAKGLRAVAVVVAAALGGGLVAAPAPTDRAPESRPAVVSPVPSGPGFAAPVGDDPLDPASLTIVVPVVGSPAPAQPGAPIGVGLPTTVSTPSPAGPGVPAPSDLPSAPAPALPAPGALPLVPGVNTAAGSVVASVISVITGGVVPASSSPDPVAGDRSSPA